MRAENISSLVDAIYEAAVDDKAISKLAERLAVFALAHTATLTLHACDMREFSVLRDYFLARMDIDFANQFLPQDIWHQTVHHLATGALNAVDDLPLREIHNRFYRSHGDESAQSLSALIATGHGVLSVTISRPLAGPPFSAAEAIRLQALVPHLQRLHVLRWQMQRLESQSDFARAALDRFAYPTLIILPDRQIVLTNAAARDALARRSHLFEQKGRLCALQSEDNRRLSDAVTLALTEGAPHEAEAEICMIGGGNGDGTRVILSAMEDRKSVFVIIDDPEAPRTLSTKIAQLYGLSAAETALAEALMRGDTPEHFAQARNVRITTVRSQLSSVLRKTDTERQSQLIAVLSRLPALKNPPEGPQ